MFWGAVYFFLLLAGVFIQSRFMELDAIIGIIVILAALTGIVILVVWSRQRIERIAARGYGSGREAVKNLDREGKNQ